MPIAWTNARSRKNKRELRILIISATKFNLKTQIEMMKKREFVSRKNQDEGEKIKKSRRIGRNKTEWAFSCL